MSEQQINQHTPETLYTVPALTWEFHENEHCEYWAASTVFCVVYVTRIRHNKEYPWGPWKFEYFIDEYVGKQVQPVNDADDGKRKAEQWYLEQLLPALQPTKQQPTKGAKKK